MKQKSLWQGASLTVEAVFVVPVLLGMAFMIIYILFLFHDRIVLKENGCEALCAMAEEGTVLKDGAMKEKVGDSLWLVEIEKAKVSKKHSTVKGTVTARAEWDIPVMAFFIDRMQEINWTQELSLVHPEELCGLKNDSKTANNDG